MAKYIMVTKDHILALSKANRRASIFIGLIFLSIGLSFIIYMLIYKPSFSDYIALIGAYTGISALFAFSALFFILSIKLYKKVWRSWIWSLEINEDEIATISVDKDKKTYPYSFFDDILMEMDISSKNSKNTKIHYYRPFYKFLIKAMDDVDKYIKDNNLSSETPIFLAVIIQKKGKISKMYGPVLRFDITSEAMGGIGNIKKMFEEWREKYEAYLKREGKYEKVMKEIEKTEKKKAMRKEKVENPQRVRIHFYTLVGIIIVAVVSFVFLPILTLLNTPPNSSDYDTWFNFLLIDGFFTIWLVIIGIAKLPKLYRKGWKGGCVIYRDMSQSS